MAKTQPHKLACAKVYREKHRDSITAKARARYWANHDTILQARRSEERKAYQKAYREAHREELKAKQKVCYEQNKDRYSEKRRAWYQRHRDAVLAKEKARYAENPEAAKVRIAIWNVAHPEKRREYNRKNAKRHPEKNRAACSRHRQKHPEFHSARLVEWRKANPEKTRANTANRRARINGNGGTHTALDIKRLLVKQDKRCVGCSCDVSKGYQVDHIMPLARGGSNGPENLQLLCRKCNQSKHAKHPEEWKKVRG